jgi:hypothetical protein
MKSHSIRAIVALCALVALATPTLAQPAEAPAGGPRAVAPDAVFDAETVPVGHQIVHDFVIRNEGTAPLEIISVQPACGCTVAEFDRTIAPGAAGKVHAILDTATFAGAIAKGITVLTNDPARPRLELTVKARVQPYLFVDPGYARFVQAQLSDPGVIEQRVWTNTFDELAILDVRSPFPYLSVEHRRIEDEADRNENGTGPQHELRFVLDYGEAPVGPLADYVVVATNHPKQPELRIPVSGFVRPLVVLTPERADFGRFQMDDDGSRGAVLLKYYGSAPLQIESVETTLPGVTANVEPVEDGREFRVWVTVGPEAPKGDFTGLVRVRTNHPRQPTVEIPVQGSVS